VVTGTLLYVYRQASKKLAERVNGRRRLDYGAAFKIGAIVCGAAALFIMYAAVQARADQVGMAFIVAIVFLRFAIYFLYRAFLVRFEYDAQAHYKTVLELGFREGVWLDCCLYSTNGWRFLIRGL